MYMALFKWLLTTCVSVFLMLVVVIAAVGFETIRYTPPGYNETDILNETQRGSEFKGDTFKDAQELNKENYVFSKDVNVNSGWTELSNGSFDKIAQDLDNSEDEISCREEEEFYFQYRAELRSYEFDNGNHTENASEENFVFDEDVNINYNIPPRGDFLAPKCCKKGEQLDSHISRCIPRPGHSVENTEVEILDINKNFRDAYWTKFSTEGVMYIAAYNRQEHLSFLGPIHLKRITEVSEVHLLSRGDVSFWPNHVSKCNISERWLIRFHDFCFDAVEGGPFAPHVFVAPLCNSVVPCMSKCCLPGEMLSKEGLCISYNNNSHFYDTDIRNSSDLLPYSFAPCMERGYDVADITESDNKMIKSSNVSFFYKMERHDVKMRCLDWQESQDGSVKRVLGTCSLVSNVKWLVIVRPLGIVTVLLLAAAVVVTVSRAEKRRSAHGRALACHAFCLMAANSLQLAAFYAGGERRCSSFVLRLRPATYFFLLAGNAWLASMTLNMLLSFRQPLGALASASRRAQAQMHKRFITMSVFSWGIASALTAFTTYMLRNFRRMADNGYHTPTFGETRICVVDGFSARYREDAGAIPMGPLLYFYVPVGLLVLINLLCVVYVFWKMRQLKRDNIVLDSAHIGSRQSRLKSALVYVKLLLMAGLVELCLEVSSWTRSNNDHEYVFDIQDKHILENAYSLTITATFVDLSRAVIVLWLCVRQGQQVCGLCKPQHWLDIWRQIRRPIFGKRVCGSNDLKESQDTSL